MDILREMRRRSLQLDSGDVERFRSSSDRRGSMAVTVDESKKAHSSGKLLHRFKLFPSFHFLFWQRICTLVLQKKYELNKKNIPNGNGLASRDKILLPKKIVESSVTSSFPSSLKRIRKVYHTYTFLLSFPIMLLSAGRAAFYFNLTYKVHDLSNTKRFPSVSFLQIQLFCFLFVCLFVFFFFFYNFGCFSLAQSSFTSLSNVNKATSLSNTMSSRRYFLKKRYLSLSSNEITNPRHVTSC